MSAKAVLITRLFVNDRLVKETSDETVWCAVLNKIVADENSKQRKAAMAKEAASA